MMGRAGLRGPCPPAGSVAYRRARAHVGHGQHRRYAVPIPGNWRLFYDWGCDGSYGSTTMYSGVVASLSVTGIQSTFTGLNGCFYLLGAGAPTALLEQRPEGARDS